MYKLIVERKTRGIFDAIGRHDVEGATKDVADDVHHTFPGDNALGGERHSKEAMIRWFERLFRLLPEMTFEVKKVTVRGWPWKTIVMVEWRDWGKSADGVDYENEGAHALILRWGKGTYVHAYLDTEKVTAVCDRLAAAGIEEAAEPPIVD